MTIRLEAKRPDEVRDYLHDWTPFLGADTIATQTNTITGATLDSATIQAGNKSVKFWISGGVDGATARLTHTIVTVGGRTETEVFVLPICEAEQISLAEVKSYLRVLHTDEDAKIAAMIPRARRWIEDHTGLALRKRTFVERQLPKWGAIRLDKGPLVSITSVAYVDNGAQTYTARSFPPSSVLWPATDGSWPELGSGEAFTITYVAGYEVGEADDRLIGGLLALIEGEYAEGHAYPPSAVDAAERCCSYLRQMVA